MTCVAWELHDPSHCTGKSKQVFAAQWHCWANRVASWRREEGMLWRSQNLSRQLLQIEWDNLDQFGTYENTWDNVGTKMRSYELCSFTAQVIMQKFCPYRQMIPSPTRLGSDNQYTSQERTWTFTATWARQRTVGTCAVSYRLLASVVFSADTINTYEYVNVNKLVAFLDRPIVLVHLENMSGWYFDIRNDSAWKRTPASAKYKKENTSSTLQYCLLRQMVSIFICFWCRRGEL